MKDTITYQLKDLTIGYRSRRRVHVVARELNATLHSGRLVCLLGPNGAGKSTLLRTLSGAQPPLDGEVSISGQRLSQFTPKQIATRVSIVLTERPNVTHMRVHELVALGRNPYTDFWGRMSADDKEAVAQAITLVGITPLAQRKLNTLSDGERQKVMIAKALAQQTPIILLDEPTAFLDFPSKVEMMLLLARLAHEMDKTIFLSTHDLDLALQTADELWLLGKDAIQQPALITGSPNELAQRGTLATFFSGKGVAFDADRLSFRVSRDEIPRAEV